jgi:PAS domain S-box-containing protein
MDYRTNLRTPDEIGQLSTAFDVMTEILQKVTVSRDELIKEIKERKHAEIALQESEVRFRELFNHMSSGVAVYEAIDNGGDFVFRDFNPAAEKIEKVSRKNILGKLVSEAFPGVKASGVFEVLQRVWQTGKLEYFPNSFYKDERDLGSRRESWVFKLPTGEIVAAYNDITERKQAEEDLQASELRYRRLFEAAKDGILILDAATGAIRDANPYILDLLDYTKDEVLGQHLSDLGFFRDAEESDVAFEKLQTNNYVRYDDLPLESRAGQSIEVEFVSNVYTVNHERVIQCNIRDISERRQAARDRLKLETQLRQSQKMEALGTLAGGIAHDFNNILGVAMGFAEIALMDAAKGSPLWEHLQHVFKATRRAKDLVQQILAFSRQTEQQRNPMQLRFILRDFSELKSERCGGARSGARQVSGRLRCG